ncbi:hypothetical protein [Bradyrhizobium erythrophlei]|uniref:Uncharacterized protein n=1 Tax=Bradyrhizobium erythrophlei TaxID=1437360 RepID=A0A1M5ICB8_9BRAD|nr:hypothetical protein [Bradyrhizobium erythrophlei]SHG25709.1 hypothetical protein SAMN05444169_1457 [Bradyrhizobium erythrophlei]
MTDAVFAVAAPFAAVVTAFGFLVFVSIHGRPRSVSFWLFVTAAELLLFQAIPIIGLLPGLLLLLFSIDAFVFYALLVHAFLLSLLIEAAIGRISRRFVIVPILMYGAYYTAYFGQARDIEEEAAKMNLVNVGKALDFDPDKMSVVFDSMGDLGSFVAHYKVPVAYFQDNYAHSESARLIPASQCAIIKNSKNGAAASIETAEYNYQMGLLTKVTAPCVLLRAEKPTNPPLYVRRAPEQQKRFAISVQSIEIFFNGQLIGTHQSLHVYRIPPILWHMGCGFSDTKPWGCLGFFSEYSETIGSEPKINDRVGYTSPLGDMLAIPKYTNEDILHFAGYPANAGIVALAQSPPAAK